MNPEPVCDLCGSQSVEFIFTTSRLDGPLYRCGTCGLYFVLPAQAAGSMPTETAHAADEMKRLAARARELLLVDPVVEEGERRWRKLTASERLQDLLSRTSLGGGSLLEIGSSTGEFLNAARERFLVVGVEADADSSGVARSNALECIHGTLSDARFPAGQFDVACLYHVIEHVPHPGRVFDELHRVLRQPGWLVVETPNVASIWFRLLGPRWRQIIPDHRYFFSPSTISRLCEESGFEVVSIESVGKSMSWRLFVDRLGRYYRPGAKLLAAFSEKFNLNDRTITLNFGDVIRVYARVR